MRTWLAWKVLAFLATEILYWLYRGVMWLKLHKDDLPRWSLPIAWLFVAVGYVADLFYNAIFGSIQFRDWPHELTFTSRLKRYKYGLNVEPWRSAEAFRICDRLNPYDPSGKHC